jgi:hypothetical protein
VYVCSFSDRKCVLILYHSHSEQSARGKGKAGKHGCVLLSSALVLIKSSSVQSETIFMAPPIMSPSSWTSRQEPYNGHGNMVFTLRDLPRLTSPLLSMINYNVLCEGLSFPHTRPLIYQFLGIYEYASSNQRSRHTKSSTLRSERDLSVQRAPWRLSRLSGPAHIAGNVQSTSA